MWALSFLLVMFLLLESATAFKLPHSVNGHSRNQQLATLKSTNTNIASNSDKPSTKGVVTKGELIERLAIATELSKSKVGQVLNGFFSVVREDVMNNNKEVKIRGFGTFKSKVVKPKILKNVFGTGKQVTTHSGKSLKMTPAKSFFIEEQ